MLILGFRNPSSFSSQLKSQHFKQRLATRRTKMREALQNNCFWEIWFHRPVGSNIFWRIIRITLLSIWYLKCSWLTTFHFEWFFFCRLKQLKVFHDAWKHFLDILMRSFFWIHSTHLFFFCARSQASCRFIIALTIFYKCAIALTYINCQMKLKIVILGRQKAVRQQFTFSSAVHLVFGAWCVNMLCACDVLLTVYDIRIVWPMSCDATTFIRTRVLFAATNKNQLLDQSRQRMILLRPQNFKSIDIQID